MIDIQKANFTKRISAFLFDFIIFCILTAGFGCLLSLVTGYDRHQETYDAIYTEYLTTYGLATYEGVDLSALSSEEYEEYISAAEAFQSAFEQNETAMSEYASIVTLSLIVISGGIFLALLVIEFIVPIIFKNGQTLGKKIFSICLMRSDCLKISPIFLFVRTFLGKFALEIMIPVLLFIKFYFGSFGIIDIMMILLLVFGQVICLIATKHDRAIHDIIASTIVVDFMSQEIFETASERDALIAQRQSEAADAAVEH